jgi:hypothetical protein
MEFDSLDNILKTKTAFECGRGTYENIRRQLYMSEGFKRVPIVSPPLLVPAHQTPSLLRLARRE